jgi:hypothetical protein
MVFLLSWLQAPLLLHGPCFSPAQRFHRARLVCRSNLAGKELTACIVKIIDSNKVPFASAGSDPSGTWFRLLRFSNTLQFLSILTLSIDESECNQSQRAASLVIESSSVAFLPAWVPLGFLFQWLLFWLPFPDFGHNLTLAMGLSNALVIAHATGGFAVGSSRLKLEAPQVLEGGYGSSLARVPLVAALAAVVSPQSRFFLVFIAMPGAILATMCARSGIVKFG